MLTRLWWAGIPPILPALIAGLVLAGITGELGAAPIALTLPSPVLTAPVFSLSAILTAAPVIVVLITLQANVPSVVFLLDQGYRPPEGTVTVVSGAGTMASSLFGPVGISLSLPATALVAGPDAGEREVRHWSAYVTAVGAVVIAALAGLATQLATLVPASLLAAVVGLAVVGILQESLRTVVEGPLLLGPLFAFGIALSELSLLGLGAFFWGSDWASRCCSSATSGRNTPPRGREVPDQAPLSCQ